MPDLAQPLAVQRRWFAHQREDQPDDQPDGHPDDQRPDVRIGVAASFTAQPLEPFLGVPLLEAGVVPDIHFAEYNQIYQVCFDPAGTVGAVDRLVILWRIEDMFGGALDRAVAGEAGALAEIADAASELGHTVGRAARDAGFSFVVSVPPFPRPIGTDLLDSVVGLRLGRAHGRAVDAFVQAVGDAPVRWADLNAWQLDLGVEQAHDVVKALVYRQPYTTRFWHAMGGHLADILIRESAPAPKCVVLDCDNTLWGGVIGEDGIGGIELGSAFPGSGYQGFQQSLRSLKDRGVLLAVASKNNPQEVDDVFGQHDDMVLRAEDIAAWRVNWNPKSQSLREIAAELNIGVDALVMIDDSDYELAEIANALPEVRRLQVPEEVGLLPDLIATSGLFRNMSLSAEDLSRTDMIRQESARQQAAGAMSREEFLTSLELVIDYIEVGEEHVGRVAQLTNKTNQFNLTTIRRTEPEIRALVASDDHLVRAIRVADKFGDYGLVGVAILATAGAEWQIDTLLMSCRVLSRGIETAFIARLVDEARRGGAEALVGRYRPTAKNVLVQDLYPKHGFTEVAPGEFRAALADITPKPEYVAVR
jgi:FkbH-like protein